MLMAPVQPGVQIGTIGLFRRVGRCPPPNRAWMTTAAAATGTKAPDAVDAVDAVTTITRRSCHRRRVYVFTRFGRFRAAADPPGSGYWLVVTKIGRPLRGRSCCRVPPGRIVSAQSADPFGGCRTTRSGRSPTSSWLCWSYMPWSPMESARLPGRRLAVTTNAARITVYRSARSPGGAYDMEVRTPIRNPPDPMYAEIEVHRTMICDRFVPRPSGVRSIRWFAPATSFSTWGRVAAS